MTYTFTQPDNTVAQRDDSAFVPWSAVAGDGPRDTGGGVYRRWKDEGSPIPGPYVAPSPTADDIRVAAFLSDIDRQALVTAVQTATPAQIKTFVTNNVTDLASARVMLMKILLLISMTVRS